MAGETRRDRTTGRDTVPESRAGELEATVARGRVAGTPFALLGSVAFLVWGALAVLAAVLLLIWWLA
jgi:hypothetical protein